MSDNKTLSICQENAKDAFQQFLKDDSKNEMVISGSAGTGKSYLVQYLAKLAKSEQALRRMLDKHTPHVPIYFTATTNKAVHVLQRSLGNKAVVNTIHSFLGLRVKSDYKTGKQKLYQAKPPNFKPGILFIDEASMINSELWLLIRKHASKCKIVYIGDPYQLTPVKEDVSNIFSMVDNFELKTIQRQALDSPIISLAQQFRTMLDEDSFPGWPEIKDDGHAIQLLDGPAFKDMVDLKFNQEHDPNDLRILAWSNLKVISYNKHVRSFYAPSDHYVENEVVATNKPIMLEDEVVAAPADSLVKIYQIREVEKSEGYEIPGFEIAHNYGHGFFLPANWKQANNLLKEYAKNKDWQNYFKIKNFWLDLRPIHSSTVHKSQGSTYHTVFIDLDDIGRNNKWKEVARLAYVAITRASDLVYFYGSLKNRYR